MKRTLAVVLASVVTLGASEAGLRMLWHNPYHEEAPDHVVKVSMNHANTDHTFDRTLLDPNSAQVRLRTDARAYILPSFQHPEPDVTIAFLGGSTTECMAVQEALRFPALVSTLLGERGVKANTLNAARSGNALHDSLNVFLNHVVDDRPNIVILMHVSNDVGVLAAHSSYRSKVGAPVEMRDLGKWLLQIASSSSYLAALTRSSATSNVVFRPQDSQGDWRHDASLLDRLPTDPYRQRLHAFIRMTRAFGAEPVLVTEPFTGSSNALTPAWIDRNAQDKFNGIVRDVGAEDEVLVIDLVRYVQEQIPNWNAPMELFYDAIHVTDRGSEVYAKHIAERLQSVMLDKGQTAQTTISTR